MDLLKIPPKDHSEYDEAIDALAHSADVFRVISHKMINEGADPKQILVEHGELLAQSELATLSWLAHLQKRKMN